LVIPFGKDTGSALQGLGDGFSIRGSFVKAEAFNGIHGLGGQVGLDSVQVLLNQGEFGFLQGGAQVSFFATSAFAMQDGAGKGLTQDFFGYQDSVYFVNHKEEVLCSKGLVDLKVKTALAIDGTSPIDPQKGAGLGVGGPSQSSTVGPAGLVSAHGRPRRTDHTPAVVKVPTKMPPPLASPFVFDTPKAKVSVRSSEMAS